MAGRYQKPAGHCGADFSRTCEGCALLVEEDMGTKKPWHRCNAPGPRKGYTVSHNGRFLPYVPAWCPLMAEKEGEQKKVGTAKENLLEKLKKIKALADRGDRGEKESAKALLEKLMQEHGITEADLEVERVETVFFPYHDELERRILIQVIFSVTGKSAFGCVGAASGRKRKKYGADCTAAQRLEIEFNHKFFYEAAKKEFEVFLYAFYMKNGIFPPESEVPVRTLEEMTPEEKGEMIRAAMMAEGMERHTPRKAIGDGGKGAKQ